MKNRKHNLPKFPSLSDWKFLFLEKNVLWDTKQHSNCLSPACLESFFRCLHLNVLPHLSWANNRIHYLPPGGISSDWTPGSCPQQFSLFHINGWSSSATDFSSSTSLERTPFSLSSLLSHDLEPSSFSPELLQQLPDWPLCYLPNRLPP